MGIEGFKPASTEKGPTIESSKNIEGENQLDNVLKVIRQKMALATEQLDRANSQEWTIGESGFAIEPKEAAQAKVKLNYLKKAHELFFKPVLGSPTSEPTLEEVLEGIENHTKLLHDHYAQEFGKLDPKDVEEAKQSSAKKLLDEIKLRDKIVEEFSAPTP